ncbi:MAG TPA: inverse autotransporter beta domain-containing protein, partial [Rhizomicrobium sp.]|nr:inverse autotransporter beta domain-containing protein [Rhizomicrobium sp.]
MRDTNIGRRLPLKSRLLIGATGIAAAGMSTAAFAADAGGTPPPAPPADPAKWVPYAEVGGQLGSGYTAGKVDFFEPVWQDLDSMLFAQAGIEISGNDNRIWDFGLGYRTKINPDWILGGYAGFDSDKNNNSSTDHEVHQYTIGAELMSADWDVRANGYFAPSKLHNDNAFGLYIHDTTIAILGSQDASYSGFDGEVGYRVFNTDSTDVRLFAGGFSFTHSDIHNPIGGGALDFSLHKIQGPEGRAEVNVFDLDDIGPQSRLSFEGEIAHDSVRGTTGFVGATLRIPLDDIGSGGGAQALDELDRRMADPERHSENVINRTIFSKPEPVIIYNGAIHSQPTNTLFYAQQQAAPGEGSYAHPTTIQDATARGPFNQFIVVTDKGGPVVATGAVVQTGETVVGGGQTFQVEGEFSHRVFTHTFAPGSGIPTLTADSAADNVLTIEGTNTVLSGLNFAGPFNDAIYGHNIGTTTINAVNIDGTAGGVNGVHIVQDVSGDSSVTISNSSISNLSNDGVYVSNTFSDGGTSTQDVHLDTTSVSNSGNDGVYINSNVSGDSTATINAELTSSPIAGSGNVGALIVTSVAAGSTATQNITIDPTTITGGLYGVEIQGSADGGTLNQYVNISDVTFSGQTVAGVAVFAYGQDNATVNQTVALNDVSVTGSYYPIGIIANAVTGAHVTQNFSLADVTVNGGTYEGVDIVAHADGAGSIVTQTGTMQDVTANNTSFGDGVYVYDESTYGGTSVQHLSITGLTATHNYDDGLYLGVSASSNTADASTAAQYVNVTNSNLAGNFIGVDISASGLGNGTAAQSVFVGNTVLSDAAHVSPGYQFVGASVAAFALDDGSVQQSVYFANDSASHNTASGIAISANSLYGGFVEQTAEIYGSPTLFSDLTHNGGYGVAVGANASEGGDIEQNISVYYVNASHNGLGGLGVNTNSYGIAAGYALYYSHVSQNIIAYHDHFDRNSGNGVTVVNYATYGAGIDQFVYVGASTMDQNTGDGVHVESHDTGASFYGYAPGTHLYADVYIFNSSASHNGGNGISIESDVTMPTDPTKVFGDSYEEQHIIVNGVTATHNGNDGFIDTASATGIYSLNLQYITLAGSTFNNNANNGAEFNATGYFGPYSFGAVLQEVTVTGGSFSRNGNDGIHATAEASGFQGRAEQYFSIFYATVDDNHHDGMSFYRHSHDGAYYPGYTCNYVQGITGGCGIIRQKVQIGYSDISHNGNDGIYVGTRAVNYGSVYSASGRPTYTASLFVEDSTINNNHGDGIHLYNYVAGHSYAYQYVVSLDNNINHNGGAGIGGLNNVTGDSTLVQKAVVYGIGTGPGSQIDDNAGSGIDIDSQATDGGRIGGLLVVGYSQIDGNRVDGIDLTAGADSGGGTVATGVQQYLDIIGA